MDYSRSFWKYSDLDLIQNIKNSDVFLITSKAVSSAALYGNLFNIPVIHLYPSKINKLTSLFCKIVNSNFSFKKYIYLAIEKPNSYEWLRQKKNFKNFFYNKHSIKNYIRFINNALKK